MYDDRDARLTGCTQVDRVFRPFLSYTARGAVFLFGKTKRKIGGRIAQVCPGEQA